MKPTLLTPLGLLLAGLATGCVQAEDPSFGSEPRRSDVETEEAIELESSEVEVAGPAAEQQNHADASCGGNNVRPVRLEWAGGKDVHVRETARIPWSLTNVTAEKRSFDIVATADSGSTRPTVIVVDHVDVAPGEGARGEVDLRELKIDPSALRYSGLLMLTALDPERDTTTVSEPIFFHADERGRLVTYDEEQLQTRFGGGDFRRGGEAVSEEGTVTTRVVSAVDVVRSDTDQLESDVRPEPTEN